MSIQLAGNLTLGTQDVSDWVSRFTINKTRETVAVPPTLGKPCGSQKAGALTEELQIDFFSDFQATSAWAVLLEALETDTAELEFEGTLDPGAISATNPQWSGTIVVTALETGQTVGELRAQSQTYPVTADGVTKTTTTV